MYYSFKHEFLINNSYTYQMTEEKLQNHEIKKLRIVILGYNNFTTSIIQKFHEESSSVSIICDLEKISPVHKKNFLNENNINLHQITNSLINDFDNVRIKESDLFLAATESDLLNLMAVQISQNIFHMSKNKAMCIISNEDLAKIYINMGIKCINTSHLITENISNELNRQ